VLAERHRVAPALMVVHLGLAVLRQAAGDWAGSEEALRAAEAVQSTLSMAGTGLGLTVRAGALLARGGLADAEPALRDAARIHPALADLHALARLAGGDVEGVRRSLGPWREQPEMIWDYLWVTHAVLRALLWGELGDADAVRALRLALEPFEDRIADGAMAALFAGSVRHALGVLALAAGDREEAARRAREAVELHRRLGWAPWERLSRELLERAVAPLG
jgi:tetratricopeptide (TPR) repeat protein